MKWFLKCLSQYTDFDGRARRKEYWMFNLFYFIFAMSIIILENLIGMTSSESFYGFLYGAFVLAMMLPSMAVTVRRLHDIGKSGWFMLIGLIPFIGGIWLFILTLTDSTPGDNDYGPNPKRMTA